MGVLSMSIFDNTSSITINNKEVASIKIGTATVFEKPTEQSLEPQNPNGGGTPDPSEVTKTIQFTITDGTAPIQGASVTIENDTHNTGSAGGCSFTLRKGTYSVSVVKQGYVTKTETIEVVSDSLGFTIVLELEGAT